MSLCVYADRLMYTIQTNIICWNYTEENGKYHLSLTKIDFADNQMEVQMISSLITDPHDKLSQISWKLIIGSWVVDQFLCLTRWIRLWACGSIGRWLSYHSLLATFSQSLTLLFLSNHRPTNLENNMYLCHGQKSNGCLESEDPWNTHRVARGRNLSPMLYKFFIFIYF